MSSTIDQLGGGYRFIPGVFQYSAGVAALPGFRIERVQFDKPVPLSDGFARIAAMLKAAGRPLQAFCACELRSPAPFTEAGFRAFNELYVGTLAGWGILQDGINPIARSNVCPAFDPPKEPGFHAFSYTAPAAVATPSFVVSGSGEAPEGKASYREHIVARGDISTAGLREKAAWVLGEMERRMAALGRGWEDASSVQVYSVHDIHPLMRDEIGRRGAARHGVTWHFCRPPVVELEFEMDCRRVSLEHVVAG